MNFNLELPDQFKNWQEVDSFAGRDNYLRINITEWSADNRPTFAGSILLAPREDRIHQSKPGMVIRYNCPVGQVTATCIGSDNWSVVVKLNVGGLMTYTSTTSNIETDVVGNIKIISEGM